MLMSKRTSASQTIERRKQILAVLWLLATPDNYRSVGERFDLGKSSLWNCFVRVINALNVIAPHIVMWPSLDERQEIQKKFRNLSRIDGCVGSIDGTYVPIKAPALNPEVYVNRKCFHGITLQAICDPTLKFTNCFTGYPSSTSDIRIFKNSDIYREFTQNGNSYFDGDQFIIGDKAYPLYTWCIPPFIDRGNLTDAQSSFNIAHASTRQVIERAFALLFGRFRRLKYLDMNRTDLLAPTIIAACVLHNICLRNGDDSIEDYIHQGNDFRINVDEHNVVVDDNQEGQIQMDGRAINKRNMMATALFRLQESNYNSD